MAGRGRADLRLCTVPSVMKQSGCSCAPRPNSSRIRAEFAEKVTRADSTAAQTIGSADVVNRLRHAAIKAERAALIRAWREHRIGDEVLHQLEEILDYQEARS